MVWLGRCSLSFVFARPSERERTECLIRAKLRSIMTCQDLDNVTSKEVSKKYLNQEVIRQIQSENRKV